MRDVPDIIRESIYRRVSRDLRPKRATVHAKIGGAVAVGGAGSLFLCGQLGFGLSSLAETVHIALMDAAGFLGCTVLCGVVFALVPVLMLRLVSSPLQFLVLIRKEWTVAATWMAVFGVAVSLRNGRADEGWVLLLWATAAVVSFAVTARALHLAFDSASWRLRTSV